MSVAHAYSLQNHDEHQDMEAIGQELGALMADGEADKAKIVHTLNMLKASMLLHFAHEEALMKDANYPNYFHHRRSHNYIMTELSVFISSHMAGRTDTVVDIWPHLKKTLDTHMGRYDADLTSYLNRAPA